MTHRRKTWTSTNDSETTENEKNWRICRERRYFFKKIDFSSSNTILDDYLMFRVVISNMIESERMKKYFINFKTKEYSNKNHAKVEKVVKRRDLIIEIWHYLIICQIFQLHDEKRKRKNLRRILLDVSTIKANEILSDICVVQSKTRDKFIVKFKKIAKESTRFVTFIKFTKSAKEFIRFITLIAKIAKEFIRLSTSIKESIREKRRNSEDDQSFHQKRFKRDESENDEEIINLKFDEFDVKFRKTRSQIRKKILKKFKEIIDKSEKHRNDSKTIAKNSIMSSVLQNSITSMSKHKKSVSTEKKIRKFVITTSQSHRELRTYTFIDEQKEQFKTEMKLLITTLEIYQKVFWNLNDEVAKLIIERQLKSFLQKWNKIVQQITKIHQKLDDVKKLTSNISLEN